MNSFRSPGFISFILLMFFTSANLYAQCLNDRVKLKDSKEIIEIARKKKIIESDSVQVGDKNIVSSVLPVLKSDSAKCEWVLTVKSYKTTLRGKCRHTNGCTVETQQTIHFSAVTGKILKRKTRKKIYPNYE